MKLIFRSVMLLGAGWLALTAASSAPAVTLTGGENMPATEDESAPLFHYSGVIDSVDLGRHEIVINKMKFKTDPDLTVHGLDDKTYSPDRLRQGTSVGFDYTLDRHHRPSRISDLWLLHW